jgi:hypothetical protein
MFWDIAASMTASASARLASRVQGSGCGPDAAASSAAAAAAPEVLPL